MYSDPYSFGFLRIVDCSPTFQEELSVSYSRVKQFFAILTLENWADKLSCNERKKFVNLRCVKSSRNADLVLNASLITPQVSRPSKNTCFCNNDKKYTVRKTSNLLAYCHSESEEKTFEIIFSSASLLCHFFKHLPHFHSTLY